MRPVVLLLTAVLAQGSREMPQPHTTHAINHYDIDVPTGYSIKDRSPAMSDFDLYEITGNRPTAKLALYFGNHPQFPKFEWSSSPHIESRNGRTTDEYLYSPKQRRMEGRIMFDGLSYKTRAHSPYTYVHYFASDVNEDDARIFEEITRSIRVARAHLD